MIVIAKKVGSDSSEDVIDKCRAWRTVGKIQSRFDMDTDLHQIQLHLPQNERTN